MKKISLGIMLCIIVSLMLAESRSVKLTSLEWPPYTGQDLPEQGASIIIAKAAFMAMGYHLTVDFYPWQRAVYKAKEGKDYIGYFPEYYAESIESEFIFSEPMGTSPLGFAEKVTLGFLLDLHSHTTVPSLSS